MISIKTAELKAISTSSLLSFASAILSPSLDVRSYGSLGGIALATYRGLAPEYVTVEYNGVRLTNVQHGLSDLALFDLNIFSAVSLSSTTSDPSATGDAGAAIIRLTPITSLTSGTYITAGTQLISYDNKVTAAERTGYLKIGQHLGDQVDIQGAISLSGSDGNYPFLQRSTNSTVLRSNNDATLANASATLSYIPDASATFQAFALYGNAERGVPGAVTIDYEGNSSFARQFDEAYLVGISAEQHLSPSFQYSLKASFQSQFESYNDSIVRIADRYANKIVAISAKTTTDIFPDLQAHIDGSFDHNLLISNENISISGDIFRDIFRTDLGLIYGIANPFSTSAVIKIEKQSDNAQYQLLPQVRAVYRFTDVSIGLAYTRLYHSPTLNELYWKVGGNPNLRPEHGYGFECTGDLAAINNFTLKATVYYHLITDQTVWQPGSGGIWTPSNVQSVRSYGTEVTAGYSLLLSEHSSLQLHYGLMLQRAENRTPGSINYGNELSYSTPLRWNASIISIWDSLGQIAVNLNYRGHRYGDMANHIKLPPVSLLNLSLQSIPIQISGNLSMSVTLAISNLFDTQYEEIPSFPLTGREYKLGVEFSY